MASRFERLVKMEREIREGTYPSVESFCRMFEVQPRTVYADLRELKQKAGLDITFDRSRNGYYMADPGKSLPAFDLTADEIMALTLSGAMLAHYTGSALEPLIQNAMQQIQRRAHSVEPVSVSDLRTVVQFVPPRIEPVSQRLLLDLCRACMEGTGADVRFCGGDGEVLERRIKPSLLVGHAGDWQLVADAEPEREPRVISLRSIRQVKLIRR